MGAYANIALGSQAGQLNEEALLDAIEAAKGQSGSGKASLLESMRVYLHGAKDTYREWLYEPLAAIRGEYAMTEEGMLDALASVSDSGKTKDLYRVFRRGLRFALLWHYYSDNKGRPGKKATLSRRAGRYKDMALKAAYRLDHLTRLAIDGGALTLTADGTAHEPDVIWIA